MENDQTKGQVIFSLFWKIIERAGTQGVQFLIQIILARLLAPRQFGILAIIMVFINLARVFVQRGFNTALIQKKYVDDEDYSSIFYLSLFIAGILYILIYLFAPLISTIYSAPILIPTLRVLSLILFTGALTSVQNAYISRNFMFKKLFKSSLGAILVSGLLGIIAAYQGLGVWALVIQQLVNQIMVSMILWFTVKWRPKFVFSFSKLRTLFSFGWKILVSSLLNTLYLDLRTLIIGGRFTSSILGYYNQGEQFPKVLVSNLNGSIQSVMLPTLSSKQDDKPRVKEITRRSIKTSSFLIFPMMMGLAVIARPLIIVVLTETWLPAVPFLQLFCISYALMPIHTANLQAIKAMGRSDIFLKLELTKKIIGILILFISLPFGVIAIAIGQVISGILSSFINANPNSTLLNYSYKEQWEDIIPSLLVSIVMGIIVYFITFLNISAWLMLIIQIFMGIIIYFGLSFFFKLESFSYLIGTIKQFLLFRKGKTL